MATAAQNMATSQGALKAIPRLKDGDFTYLEQTASPEHTLHDPAAPDLEPGLNATKEYLQSYAVAFPDLSFRIEDAFASGDGNKVVTRWIMRGTNSGPMQGMPPTGNCVEIEGMTIDQYNADGKAVETWNLFDTLTFVEQLGVFSQAGEESSETRPDAH